MTTATAPNNMAQRHRTSLRHMDYVVEPIPIRIARAFVERHHYMHGMANTAVATYGLFPRGSRQLLGVTVWMPPLPGAARRVHPENPAAVLMLSRLAVAPEGPRNAASFLLARSVRFLVRERRWEVLVTYADGWQGHEGQIYRAANWQYVGMTRPQPVFVNPLTGRVRSVVATHHIPPHELRAQGFQCAGYHQKHCFILDLRRSRRTRPLQQTRLTEYD